MPTAFYRHFASIEELGLALVDASFASLRQMMREARREWTDIDAVIDPVGRASWPATCTSGAEYFTVHVPRADERASTSVREAIRHELELFERELATDLARLPGPADWSTEDLRVLVNLIVGLMVNTTEAILTAPRPEVEQAVLAHRRAADPVHSSSAPPTGRHALPSDPRRSSAQ